MKRIFIDTSFIQAIANKNDQFHEQAVRLKDVVQKANELWIHEGILIEVADALSRLNRIHAISFYHSCQKDPRFKIEPLSSELIKQSFSIYAKYSDKTWGLTDCISFCVMRKYGIQNALTADQHFEQRGFTALLL